MVILPCPVITAPRKMTPGKVVSKTTKRMEHKTSKFTKKLKVVITGSRSFNDYKLLKKRCDYVLKDVNRVEIVSGNARGADKLGERYAKENGYKLYLFLAEWDRWGKSAGYRRNVQMGEYADVVIIFWDGISLGTKHMIDITKKLQKPLRIFKF